MKIAQLTAGTGSFYCGNCIRDTTLVKALRARGQDAHLVPLYLPIIAEIDTAEITATPKHQKPLFYGGINVYLQQKLRAFRWTPRWIDSLFDSDWMIRQASARTHMTRARDLGELTVSMLEGESGRQIKELDRLLKWLAEEERPDLVNLSNILLVGMAPAIKQRLGVPVTCTLHGEDGYLDSLPEPYREQAWELVRHHAKGLDAVMAVSEYYRGIMAPRIGREPHKIDVVHNGVSLAGYPQGPDPQKPHVWGYLARMCHAKGLTTLVDAFLQIKEMEGFSDLKLHIAGAATKADDEYLAGLKAKIAAKGVAEDVQWSPNITPDEKKKFFGRLSLFSVPANYGEAFGLYVIEAAAAGVPVVQPRHGAFPELAKHIGLEEPCEPENPGDLAARAVALLSDHEAALTRARASREIVHEKFSDAAMAERVEAIYQRALSNFAEKEEEKTIHA